MFTRGYFAEPCTSTRLHTYATPVLGLDQGSDRAEVLAIVRAVECLLHLGISCFEMQTHSVRLVGDCQWVVQHAQLHVGSRLDADC